MKPNTRLTRLILVIPLLAIAIAVQHPIDQNRKYFQPGRDVSVTRDIHNNPVALPAQFVAATVIGFREVVAGLLWIRTDSFFHAGKFEAMVPLFRVVTWLDPHQLDVYSTGAWHMAYNFTDSQERADHRYLKPAVAFMGEGIENNPDVWDLKVAMGFTLHYLKTYDFKQAAYWLHKATFDKDCKPMVGHLIAHAYERDGLLDAAEKQWQHCIKNEEVFVAAHPDDLEAHRNLDVSHRNLDSLLIRRAQRANLSKHPVDMGFDAEVIKLKPRVFIVSGKVNLPDGARIDMTLVDANHKEEKADTVGFTVNTDATELYEIGMHGISVRNHRFTAKYNLVKDIKQYPFTQAAYKITLSYNPRTSDSKAQDIVGWSGDGMTDKRYLDTSTPGIRRLKKVIILSRNDLI